MTKMPTNSDLARIINSNHEEVTRRLEAVETQVKLTNGRVKDLERKEIGREAIATYRAGEASKRRFDLTTFIALLTALATVVAALWWTAHK